jgi:hypothetical protein
MDWIRKDALLSGSCIWRDGQGEPWLIVFDFAEVDGRLECVGVQVRSCLKTRGEDRAGRYSACYVGEFTREDLSSIPPDAPEPTIANAYARQADPGAFEEEELKPIHPALMYDQDAVSAVFFDEQGGWRPKRSPRPLRVAMIREIPLGALMATVRRRIAAVWDSGVIAPATAVREVEIEEGDVLRDLLSPPLLTREAAVTERAELEDRTWQLLRDVKRRGGWDDELIRRRDDLGRLFAQLDERTPVPRLTGRPPSRSPLATIDAAAFTRLTQEAASSYRQPDQKAGRPPKYSMAQLEMVAKTYREAVLKGSRSPTADVAEKLDFTRSQAAKLVMRCRDPRIALLGKTDQRKAGGVHLPPAKARDGSET